MAKTLTSDEVRRDTIKTTAHLELLTEQIIAAASLPDRNDTPEDETEVV